MSLGHVGQWPVRTCGALLWLAAFVLLPAADVIRSADVIVDLDEASSGSAVVVDFEFGSNELHDIFVDEGVARAREAGLDSVRIWLGHRFLTAAVRSTTPLDLDWELLFDYVGRVLAVGAKPHISFVAAPAWIYTPDGRPSSQHESEVLGPIGVQAYGDYVAEVIDQLRQRFGEAALGWRYAIWNEPNNHQNAGSAYACGSGEAYVELFARARATTDARFGPGQIVLGGPSLDAIDTGTTLNATGTPVCGSVPDHDWLTYLASVDAMAALDFIVWHWYGMFEIGRADPHEALTERLDWFEERVRKITELADGRPHFVEEINYNGDLKADPLIDTQVNAAFMASATLRAIRQGASGIMVYKGTRGPDGLTPRGEPDFGLWSGGPAVEPTPAFHVLQMLRRALPDGSRLVRVEVGPGDLDALAVVGARGAVLVIVNLSDELRDVRIAGIGAGPVIQSDDLGRWRGDWFDGHSLQLRSHGVAVILPGATSLAALPMVKAGAAAYAAPGTSLACAGCHGFDAQDGPGPMIRGAAPHVFDASHAARLSESGDIAAFLAGLGSSSHVFDGRVTDGLGVPIKDAMVLADFGDFGMTAMTGTDGMFRLAAARGDGGPFALAPTLRVLHPAYVAADGADSRVARSPTRTDVVFVMDRITADLEQPLVASPHVVPHQELGVPTGVWTIGVATAGDNLTVWAVDRDSQRAVRLQKVDDHPFGLFDARIGAMNLTSRLLGVTRFDEQRYWTILAVSSQGSASHFVDVRPSVPPVG